MNNEESKTTEEKSKVETNETATKSETSVIPSSNESMDKLLDEMNIIKARLFALTEKERESDKPNGKKQLHY